MHPQIGLSECPLDGRHGRRPPVLQAHWRKVLLELFTMDFTNGSGWANTFSRHFSDKQTRTPPGVMGGVPNEEVEL